MRSRRMQPIVHHADQREQDALGRMAEAQKALQQLEQQQTQMQDYRDEYLAGMGSCVSGFNGQQLKDYQAFLQRLGGVIDQLGFQIQESRHQVERRRQEWLACRSRAQALEKVMQNYQQQENREEQRREQKLQDEMGVHLLRLAHKLRH